MADLTTLAAVKAHLNVTSTTQDALISGFIARESKAIENFTSRRFPVLVSTARRLNGSGSTSLTLPDTPILEVALLKVDNVEVPASTDGVLAGYIHDEHTIYLIGGQRFPMGKQNVICTWTAGYQESETDFIPSGNTPTLTPTEGGRAVTNVSVTNTATDVVMTEVGSSPATGQYSFASGTYTFAAADVGVQVTMSYYYVPGPIEQACIDMVSQDLKGRDNIGVRSRTMAAETVTYSSDGMSTGVKQALYAYRRNVPA